MAEIILTPGELPPPACGYASEQERFEAYVSAIEATIEGGIQWQSSLDQPDDLEIYWLKLDADDRPVAVLEYSEADGRYVRWRNVPSTDGVVGGTPDVVTLTFDPAFTMATAYQQGRQYIVRASGTNTGPVTVNIDGVGAVALTKNGGAPLDAGDIVDDQMLVLVGNGTSLELQNPVDVQEPQFLTYESDNEAIPAHEATEVFPHGFTDGSEGIKPFMVRAVLVRTAIGSVTIGSMSVAEGQELECDMFWSARTGSEGGNDIYKVFRVRADDVNIYVTAFYPHDIAVVEDFIDGNDAQVKIINNDYALKVYALAENPAF